jgi:hypothetical protein
MLNPAGLAVFLGKSRFVELDNGSSQVGLNLVLEVFPLVGHRDKHSLGNSDSYGGILGSGHEYQLWRYHTTNSRGELLSLADQSRVPQVEVRFPQGLKIRGSWELYSEGGIQNAVRHQEPRGAFDGFEPSIFPTTIEVVVSS